jgi:hypothetical protein
MDLRSSPWTRGRTVANIALFSAKSIRVPVPSLRCLPIYKSSLAANQNYEYDCRSSQRRLSQIQYSQTWPAGLDGSVCLSALSFERTLLLRVNQWIIVLWAPITRMGLLRGRFELSLKALEQCSCMQHCIGLTKSICNCGHSKLSRLSIFGIGCPSIQMTLIPSKSSSMSNKILVSSPICMCGDLGRTCLIRKSKSGASYQGGSPIVVVVN